MEKLIDDDLIRESQRGSRSAFEQLLELLYDTIYRFALKWAGCVTDAEDITQQVCVKLARAIQQFRFESAFTTWLYRVVMNCAKDWSRSQQRHRHSPDDTHAQEAVSSETSLEAGTELDRVLAVVANMGEGYLETIILVYAEGFSHREAGEILGVKESTISWRLHEIKKRLKRYQQHENLGVAQ